MEPLKLPLLVMFSPDYKNKNKTLKGVYPPRKHPAVIPINDHKRIVLQLIHFAQRPWPGFVSPQTIALTMCFPTIIVT